MSTLRLVASNGPRYENYRPRQTTLVQRKFLWVIERKGVSVIAVLEAESILVGNTSNFAAATPAEIELMRREAKKRGIVRFDGKPL